MKFVSNSVWFKDMTLRQNVNNEATISMRTDINVVHLSSVFTESDAAFLTIYGKIYGTLQLSAICLSIKADLDWIRFP
jgi:hypothetical protein